MKCRLLFPALLLLLAWGCQPSPAANPSITKAITGLQNPDKTERSKAAQVLFGYGEEAVPALRAEITKESEHRKWMSIMLIDALQNRSCDDEIIACLDDEYLPTRNAACRAIGDLKIKKAIPKLIALASGPDAAEPLYSLAYFDPAAGKALFRSHLKSKVELELLAAIHGVIRAKDQDAVPDLFPLTRSPDLSVRCAAITALYYLQPKAPETEAATSNVFREFETSSDLSTQVLLVQTAAQIDLAPARNLLILASANHPARVMNEAAVAMGELRSQDFIPALESQLARKDKYLGGGNALVALSKITPDTALPFALKAITGGTSSDLSFSAPFALKNIKSPKATKALQNMLKSPSEPIRIRALCLLGDLGIKDPAGQKVLAELKEILTTSDNRRFTYDRSSELSIYINNFYDVKAEWATELLDIARKDRDPRVRAAAKGWSYLPKEMGLKGYDLLDLPEPKGKVENIL